MSKASVKFEQEIAEARAQTLTPPAAKRVKVAIWLPPTIRVAMQHAAIDENCSLGDLVEQLWLTRTTVIKRG